MRGKTITIVNSERAINIQQIRKIKLVKNENRALVHARVRIFLCDVPSPARERDFARRSPTPQTPLGKFELLRSENRALV